MGDVEQRRVVGFLTRRGVAAGDRVVVLGENDARFLDLTMGCLRAGIIPVPLPTGHPPAALAELVADADPALVVAWPAFADLVAGPTTVVVDDAWPDADPVATLPRWPQARAMHYTSGTTGRSKGVHSGVLGTEGGRAVCEDERRVWGFRADDVHLVCGPLYHSGPHRFAINTMAFGGRVVVLPRFDAGAVLDAIGSEGVTTSFMVPTHLVRLLEHPRLDAADLSMLRWIAHAGAPCPEPLKRRALDAFPPDTVWEFYGATEGQFTAIGPDEWLRRPGSVGRARPGRTLSVRDDDGRRLPPGEVGRIWVTAPAFARFEYWRAPDRTADVWDGDAFTVGDIGRLDDDGFLYLAGREGDVVITGGVNVYPAEVEQILLAHPGVSECAVFGLPDEEWGERLCAAIVARRGQAIDGAAVRAWLRERLPPAATPKQVLIVDDLPRTGSGKVLRSRLGGLVDLRS